MNGLRIEQDTQLEPRVYLLPEGIAIDSDDVTLDGHGATILGMDRTGEGVKVFGGRLRRVSGSRQLPSHKPRGLIHCIDRNQ